MLTNAVYIIHETTDYDKFSFDPSNRPINYGHLRKLTEAIQEKNLLAEFPIVVDPDMIVRDGQHRLRAAQALGVPIFYIISVSLERSDVPKINNTNLHWTINDNLHTYIARGYPEYEALRKFTRDYPGIHLSDAAVLCYRNGDNHSYVKMSNEMKKIFSDGNYVCNNLPFANEVASVLMDFKTYFPRYYNQRVFVHAVAFLVGDPRYSHARMMQKMRYLSAWLKPCVKTSDYMPMLNKIYNYRVADGEEVEFVYYENGRKAKKAA
jgi:hypothetical protein